jgi:hypothetical protein
LVLVLLVVGVVARDEPTKSRTPVTGVPTGATELARFSMKWVAQPWGGMVYDGRAVWAVERAVVNDADGTSRTDVAVVRRNAATGKVTKRIHVPQESAHSIAFDGVSSLYVIGGGDGAVPDTTVSGIDTVSGAVRFTTRLTAPCSCQIAAGPAGVWIGANGSDVAYRLDGTGKIASTVQLAQRATALAVVGDVLELGLADSRVVVVDPVNEEVVRSIDLVRPGEGPARGDRSVVAITPFATPELVWSSWVTRVDGTSFLIAENRQLIKRRRFPPEVEAVALLGDALYARDRLGGLDTWVRSTVDARKSMIHIRLSPGERASGPGGSVLAAGPNLWVQDSDPGHTTVIVRPRSGSGVTRNEPK